MHEYLNETLWESLHNIAEAYRNQRFGYKHEFYPLQRFISCIHCYFAARILIILSKICAVLP